MPFLKAFTSISPAYYRVALHVLFWMLFLVLRIYLTLITFNVYSGLPTGIVITLNIFSLAFIIGFYYLLLYWIWPKFPERKKYLKAILIILLITVTYTAADAYAEKKILYSCSACIVTLKNDQPQYYSLIRSDISNIVMKRFVSLGTPFSLILSICIPLSVKMARNAYRSSINSLRLSEENLRLELSFLKGQLNPHFLFNSMNNIYGLIISGEKEKSAGLVSRLSELLRYMLYDSNAEMMPVEKELKLIRDYIELEKVRFNYTRVDFDSSTDDRRYELAPLLLIPLIENAFKFNADQPSSRIQISLRITEGNLEFQIMNPINFHRQPGSGGIGLKNLEKRLELCYPGKYHYTAAVKKDVYSVNLTIKLA